MNKIATIEKIHSIRVHPNADKLACAKVLEWPVVIKKDDNYKDGDLVVFIQIDTIVDKDNPYFAFMEKQKWRTWNARFRGEPSSGLVCPLKLVLKKGMKLEDCIEGTEVSELLKCTHYEKPLAAEVMGMAKGNFPTKYVSITDETNLLSAPRTLKEFDGLTCYISMKMDGSSCTMIRNETEEMVCSRRLTLKEGDSAFWQMQRKYDVFNKMRQLGINGALQGEVCGPKINGNKMDLTELDYYVFTYRDFSTMEYVGLSGLYSICGSLALRMVPVLHTFRWDETWNIERLREFANNLTYPNGKPAEGIVVRPVLSRYSESLQGMLSVKIINQNYKE